MKRKFASFLNSNFKKTMSLASSLIEATGVSRSDAVEFISKFEFVMIFPMIKVDGSDKRVQSNEARVCTNVMLERGLELFTYLSVQDDELYVLIHCPVSSYSNFTHFIVRNYCRTRSCSISQTLSIILF